MVAFSELLNQDAFNGSVAKTFETHNTLHQWTRLEEKEQEKFKPEFPNLVDEE